MIIVSYNIHYAIGKDERYDLARVVDAVRGADIIALQEVERFYDSADSPSQPEDIAALLPDYYWVYDAAFDIDCSERLDDGRVVNRRRQHGQMLLARWPILAKRYFTLPRVRIDTEFNMQMGALEAVIDKPGEPVRVYNVHFGSVSADERRLQVARLLDLVHNAPVDGGAWTGPNGEYSERDWCVGQDAPPMPVPAIVVGDFNLEPADAEYEDLCNNTGLTDLWAQFNPDGEVMSWHSNPARSGPVESARLDYCMVTEEWRQRAVTCRIDEQANGSDHQPLWAEFTD